MRVFVTGATGVLGRHTIMALQAAGHHVTGLVRDAGKARRLTSLGAKPVAVSVFDDEELSAAMRGSDAVCNLVTHVPIGTAVARPRAWKTHDRLRTEGSRVVAEAARAAGVRRLVQESVSLMYPSSGDSWITEHSPLDVTHAVEPAAVAEANATRFTCSSRASVVLRFAHLVGDDRITRWWLRQARAGRPVGLGLPDGWAHLVHPWDAATAIVAALTAPGGVYNVGADPVRRADVMAVFAGAVGRDRLGFLPKPLVRLAGERVELLTRSHRVASDKLHEATGWKPSYHTFDVSWLPVT